MWGLGCWQDGGRGWGRGDASCKVCVYFGSILFHLFILLFSFLYYFFITIYTAFFFFFFFFLHHHFHLPHKNHVLFMFLFSAPHSVYWIGDNSAFGWVNENALLCCILLKSFLKRAKILFFFVCFWIFWLKQTEAIVLLFKTNKLKRMHSFQFSNRTD